MILTLAFHPGDVDQALALLQFINQLGGTQHYDCLLVADAGVDWAKCVDLLSIANDAFRSAQLICTERPVYGWPEGGNALWLKAAQHAKAHNVHFLWLEPDSCPVKRGWLIAIDKMKGPAFTGHIYDWPKVGKQVMSGIAVYPPHAIDLIEPIIAAAPTTAWDVSAADIILRQATPTRLIQHFWGEQDLPPTFSEIRTPDSPKNTFTLENIHPEAVIFHRCKNLTLQELMRRKFGLAAPLNFVVVLPFWNGDVELLIRNLDWMNAMGMPKTHDCMLSYENTTLSDSVNRVLARAKDVFCSVQQTSYSVPHGTRFPQTAAWQHAARVMEAHWRNWLWMEPDAVPLKVNWLTVLQTVYDNSKYAFVGPMVEGAAHMNGSPAIYPADTPKRLPRAMSHTDNAFDMEASEEMRGNTKDIGHIAVAFWGVKDGRLNPLEGESPTFPPGSPLLSQIPKTAVVFHRCKDPSLVSRLLEILK